MKQKGTFLKCTTDDDYLIRNLQINQRLNRKHFYMKNQIVRKNKNKNLGTKMIYKKNNNHRKREADT